MPVRSYHGGGGGGSGFTDRIGPIVGSMITCACQAIVPSSAVMVIGFACTVFQYHSDRIAWITECAAAEAAEAKALVKVTSAAAALGRRQRDKVVRVRNHDIELAPGLFGPRNGSHQDDFARHIAVGWIASQLIPAITYLGNDPDSRHPAGPILR